MRDRIVSDVALASSYRLLTCSLLLRTRLVAAVGWPPSLQRPHPGIRLGRGAVHAAGAEPWAVIPVTSPFVDDNEVLCRLTCDILRLDRADHSLAGATHTCQ